MDDLLEIPVSLPESKPKIEDQTEITITPASVPPLNSPAPIPAMPSVEDMQQVLEKSGELLNDVPTDDGKNKIDTSPLAALQPKNMIITDQGPQPMALPSTKEKGLKEFTGLTVISNHAENILHKFNLGRLHHYLLALLLTVQGGWGIALAIRWTVRDYPTLEAQQLISVIDQTTLNAFILKIAVTGVIGIFSLLLALILILQSKHKFFQIIVGISLISLNLASDHFLPSKFAVSNPFSSFGQQTQDQINQQLDNNQFLEQNSQGNFDVVWEK